MFHFQHQFQIFQKLLGFLVVGISQFVWIMKVLFGENNHGQLGTGNTTNFNVPQKIRDIPPVLAVAWNPSLVDHQMMIICGHVGQIISDNYVTEIR